MVGSNMIVEREIFDVAVFEDSFAEEIEWTPIKHGGTNFKTRSLVHIDDDKIEFKPTISIVILSLIFLLSGLAATGIFAYNAFNYGFGTGQIIGIIVGAIFALVGAIILYSGTSPIVFDARKRYFWQGRKAPDEVTNKDEIKEYCAFDDIYALQTISEVCSGNDSGDYLSYELNIVLTNGERVNVIDHGNVEALQEDAITLAEWLEVPLWDSLAF